MKQGADELPSFAIPVLVREVPAALVALPAGAEVRSSRSAGSYGHSGIQKAGNLAAELRDIAERQAAGWLTIDEATQLLADAGAGCVETWCKKLMQAALNGALPMHEPGTLERKVYGGPSGPVRTFHEYAHIDDLNQWLDANEPRLPFRFDQQQHLPNASSGKQATKPVSRQRAQEAAILEKLAELGYDAAGLPAPALGGTSEARQAVKAALGLTNEVFKKAWQRLRSDGRIKDA